LSGKLMAIDAKTMETRILYFSADENREKISKIGLPDDFRFVEISPQEYVNRKEDGWKPLLLDVRSGEEALIATIEDTEMRIRHIDVPSRLEEIPRDRDLVIYCRVGGRSASVARFIAESRWTKMRVYNLTGGIHLWSDTIDSSINKY